MELDSGLTGTNILYNSSTAFCFMYTWINLNSKCVCWRIRFEVYFCLQLYIKYMDR